MKTPIHIQLLADMNSKIIPTLTQKGNYVVTGNVDRPDVFEVRAFGNTKSISTYPVATINVCNPCVKVGYSSTAKENDMKYVKKALDGYPTNIL